MYVDLGLTVLRLVVGAVLMAHGLQKLGYLGGSGPSGTAGMLGKLGFRPEPVWAAILVAVETGGGAITLLGLLGPMGPWLIVGDMVVAGAAVHWRNGFWNMKGGIEFPLTLGTAALTIALVGVGGWSADALLGLTVPAWIVQGWIGLVILGVVLAFASRTLAADEEGEAASGSS
jgi:putative oxidoreductase